MRIALFITCFNDALFPKTGRALVRILEDLGHQVTFPPDQTCCGQVHYNSGYRKEARRLLAHFLKVFGEAEVVVAPSASCVAMIREQYLDLVSEEGKGEVESDVRALAGRTYEMSEFLVGRLGVEDVGATFHGRVALHPTCHSRRGIDVGDAPERLLRKVRGLELVGLPNALECCGFGGTFAVKNPDLSLAMLSDKIQDVRDSGAETLTAVDNSCLIHIAGGLRRNGLLREVHGSETGFPQDVETDRNRPNGTGRIQVMHLAEILASRDTGPS